jgi:hypothetical protein
VPTIASTTSKDNTPNISLIELPPVLVQDHSHSIVAGGLLDTS